MSQLRSRRAPPLVAAALLSAFGTAAGPAGGQTCTTGPFVKGIDVSNDQGTINWSSVAGAGIGFAYMKATQGTYETDSTFAANWSGAKAAGVVRGAYHFLDPTQSGADQAAYFLKAMGTLDPGDLPPMLDTECPTSNTATDNCLGTGSSGAEPGSVITKAINDWMSAVKTATGRTPVIYSYGSWFADVNVDTAGFTAYPLWIADYSGTSCFSVPSPWTTAAIWQYGDTGTVAGISGQVDEDYFLGDAGALAGFVAASGGDASVPPPPFAPPSQVNGNDALSLVNWSDGHIELYATTTGGVASRIDTTAGEASPADTWSSPVALSGTASCGVASVYWAAGSGHTTEVFDGLPDGTTESLEYEASSSSFTSFTPFGGIGLNHLSTLAYPDSHVEVFALGDDGAIWHNVSTQSSWGGWSSMGAIAGAFVTGAGPILWKDGHAEVFATDATGVVWHNATGTASPPVWGGWKALAGGSIASRPIPARWSDGHVEVFARGTDGHLYASEYANGAFPAFTVVNASQTIAGDPSVLVYPAYGPEIFARDTSGNLIHMWNTSDSPADAGTVWSAWANDFGKVLASDPMAWLRPDNIAEVFGVDESGALGKSLHSGSTWSAWATIGSGFEPCVGGTKLVDAGVPKSGSSDGGASTDAGTTPDASVHTDAATGAPDGGALVSRAASGCSCELAGRTDGESSLFPAFVFGLFGLGRRRPQRACRISANARLR